MQNVNGVSASTQSEVTEPAPVNAETSSVRKSDVRNAATGTVMDKVANELSTILTDGVNRANSGQVKSDVIDVIRTVMEINRLSSYQNHLTVNGLVYVVSDFEVCDAFKGLIAPSAIRVIDDEMATDLIDRDAFIMTKGKVLNPDELRKAQILIFNRLRGHCQLNVVERNVSLLNAALSDGVMIKGKVHSSSQAKIVPISDLGLFEDGYYTLDPVRNWAVRYGSNILNNLKSNN